MVSSDVHLLPLALLLYLFADHVCINKQKLGTLMMDNLYYKKQPHLCPFALGRAIDSVGVIQKTARALYIILIVVVSANVHCGSNVWD